MAKKPKLTAQSPLDELFSKESEATRQVLREHKAAKRNQQRADFLARVNEVDLSQTRDER